MADNGWGVAGEPIYFATTGIHRLRLQAREDGIIVDQIVLSPTTYFVAAPGRVKRSDDFRRTLDDDHHLQPDDRSDVGGGLGRWLGVGRRHGRADT